MMIGLVLVVLVILWLLGYITVPGVPLHNIGLFTMNHHLISLWDVLIFFAILWLIDLLPTPFRQIAAVILLLYTLSTLGIIAVAGLSSILVIAMIVGLVVYLFNAQPHK